jgi:hypothetical protein
MMEEWGYEAKKGLGAEQQGMTELITLKESGFGLG